MSKSKVHKYEFCGKIKKIGYRVVTLDMKSLGLRNNPNIVEYSLNNWTYPVEKDIVKGISDKGGLWAARTPGAARAYQKYMLKKHGQETRVFKSLIGKVLFENNERIKTDKIFMFEEMDLLK